MIETIKKYSVMCRDAVEKTEKTTLPEYEFNKIIVCGVGGSAIGGDMLKDLLRDRVRVPIEVSRQYHLPAYADENTLAFCVSYSGNTEETLSQFVDAIEKKCKIIGITSGGKLKEWCKKLNLPVIRVPKGYQPRVALPYLFFPMLVCLQRLGVANFKKEIDETIRVLRDVKTESVKKIALSLKNSIPVIYASSEFSAVAKRMKTQFNENSKIPAKHDIFPELNHNEIVGYQNEELNKNSYVIILRDKDEPKEIQTRIEISKELIKNKVKGIEEIWAKGETKLAKMMSLIFLGDLLSCELAMLNGVDPIQTENISILKNELEKRLKTVKRLEKKLTNFSA
jgi:glucose/mannose-6-phosphate isomerase